MQNPQTMSEVRKYLSKVYGPELLNRIKSEEIEERNRRARQEADERKRQLELKKQQQKNESTRKTTTSDPTKRPAFLTIQEPFQSYRTHASHFYLF